MTVKDDEIALARVWPTVMASWLQKPAALNPAQEARAQPEAAGRPPPSPEPIWPRVFPGL